MNYSQQIVKDAHALVAKPGGRKVLSKLVDLDDDQLPGVQTPEVLELEVLPPAWFLPSDRYDARAGKNIPMTERQVVEEFVREGPCDQLLAAAQNALVPVGDIEPDDEWAARAVACRIVDDLRALILTAVKRSERRLLVREASLEPCGPAETSHGLHQLLLCDAERPPEAFRKLASHYLRDMVKAETDGGEELFDREQKRRGRHAEEAAA